MEWSEWGHAGWLGDPVGMGRSLSRLYQGQHPAYCKVSPSGELGRVSLGVTFYKRM